MSPPRSSQVSAQPKGSWFLWRRGLQCLYLLVGFFAPFLLSLLVQDACVVPVGDKTWVRSWPCLGWPGIFRPVGG